jgi:hypothetical protein
MKANNDLSDNRVEAMQQVIRNLRVDDLKNGHCFMIFDDELPGGQAYYEYPGGDIHIEQIDRHNLESPRVVIKILTKKEISALKEKHEIFI